MSSPLKVRRNHRKHYRVNITRAVLLELCKILHSKLQRYIVNQSERSQQFSPGRQLKTVNYERNLFSPRRFEHFLFHFLETILLVECSGMSFVSSSSDNDRLHPLFLLICNSSLQHFSAYSHSLILWKNHDTVQFRCSGIMPYDLSKADYFAPILQGQIESCLF